MLNIRKVVKQMFKESPFSCVVLLFILVSQSLLPAITLHLLNEFILSVQNGVERQNVFYLFLYLVFTMVIPFLLSTLYQLLQLKIQKGVDIFFSSNILSRTQEVSITHLESGNGVNSTFRASQTQANGIQNFVFSMINMLLVLIQIIIVTLSMKTVGICILSIIILFSIPMFFLNRKIDNLNLHGYWDTDENRRKANNLFSVLISKNTASELWLYKTRKKYYKHYEHQIDKIHSIDRKNSLKIKKVVLLADSFYQICFFVIVIMIAYLMLNRAYQSAFCITLIYATQNLMSFCNTMLQSVVSVHRQKQIINEYNTVFKWQVETDEKTPQIPFNFKKLNLINISYRYEGQQFNALNNINLEIKKGEHVVLVGANGSGKSTLLRLMLGYDNPQSGRYTIDGIPITDVLKTLRYNSSIMFQKFWKYNMSIKQNIVLSDSSIDDISYYNEIKRKTNVCDIVDKLKNTDDTEVIHGGLLSGGQWQKVALARTYYRDRQIVFMDEPNSAIDALYELRIYQDFLEFFKGKTVVVVSHRLPICQLADRIIVMDKGMIVEDGNHHELMEKKGVYFNMFKKQADIYMD